jgi:hypothetical protein
MLVCLESVQYSKIVVYLVVQGAQNAGFLATVWVNVHNLEGPPAGGPVPHHIIPNSGELPGVLEEFGALSENPPKTSTM